MDTFKTYKSISRDHFKDDSLQLKTLFSQKQSEVEKYRPAQRQPEP